MTDKWSEKWPEKAGYYWVYWRSHIDAKEGRELRFGLAQVRGPTANGDYAYIVDGHFLYDAEVDIVFWKSAEVPTLPKQYNQRGKSR